MTEGIFEFASKKRISKDKADQQPTFNEEYTDFLTFKW